MPSATEEHPSITIGDQQQTSPHSGESALRSSARFLQQYWGRVLLISGVVLIPCFWHRHIEAGDLGSHTYNAWLAELVARGQAPGLWIARQWNNILFDVALSSLGSVIGLRAAEKVVVSAAVFIFFWGAFALLCAAAKRATWFVLPCLAIFAYSWTFEMGFLNFYISLGLAFAGLALIWRGRGREQLWLLGLAALTWLAHPLGTALLAGAGAYLALTRLLRPRFQPYAVLGAALCLLAVRFYITSHFPVRWPLASIRTFTGADQLLLYGSRYQLPQLLLLALLVALPLADVVSRRKSPVLLAPYGIPLQLYVLAVLAVWLLPSGIRLPQYPAPLNLLTERLTLICGVFACSLLAVMKPQKWHLAALTVVAAIFFGFLYQDTARVDRMETEVERLVATLPQGQRISSTVWTFPGSRIFIMHIVDRASIGHAFSYGNYEPSTQQFRIRALPGNPIVVANFAASDAIETGRYIVQQQDLPMVQIYQCDLTMTRLCMRELTAGELNGRYGLQPVAR